MKLLVLQHLAVEHPGVFRDFLHEDGAVLHTVELDEGEPIPDLEPFDAMIVMGGPQDVWQEDAFPWLKQEKATIRRFVADMGRPYLGLCLGHQLLADALGGHVGPGTRPEVGALTISQTEHGRRDPLFKGVPDPIEVLQWHGAEVKALPEGAVHLARSDVCEMQAFRYGARAYGLQCHVEATRDTVADWAAIPEYARALEATLGAGSVARLEQDVKERLPTYTAVARTLYENFKTQL
ncbi:type 1 glutamine amidotransferase [Hyphomicrobium sp.]|uniref:type 1 glutamine amidotransferase n=1 Tax=Hyphomicrobium sp. TaxID=82 RepID=UPI0025B89FB2|nr:type 1 glutamine amidotransferase [Hyphomicrobium sp.]MCC7252657.1 type 1 glutamine amidotransferase [Hyphomicrobium sp.]